MLLFLFIQSSYAQKNYKEPDYKFLDKFEDADLNYSRIDSINSFAKGIIMLDSVFTPTKGKYTVYRFMTYDHGVLFDEVESDLNNLIILKVNSKNEIIEGYQYFLQTPEMPSSCWLYKVTRKEKLKPEIKINDLRFKRKYKATKGYDVCSSTPKFLKDKRYLKLKDL